MPLNPASPLARLMSAPVRPGVVTWIGLRPAHRAEMVTPQSAEIRQGQGLVGDRWRGRPGGRGTREVTVISQEELAAIASYLGREVSPEHLRRNIVVRGVNLRALKDSRFRIGNVVLEATGDCHPCSRMEEALGVGGYNAVRGHGGLTARVIGEGWIRLGDEIVPIGPQQICTD